MSRTGESRRRAIASATPAVRAASAAVLIALVLAVFWQTGGYGFVNFDDPSYVYRNPWVLRGLTGDSIRWAFGGIRVANWHPLTWLSHMLDVELFGADPGSHHLVNVALHAVNTLLLFRLLEAMTGAMVRSAAVAALFGIHPLHVESVAWISERKDVLSTVLLLLTLAAYVAYARSGRRGAYLASLGLLALGLMAKPMLVTTPFVLLLIDAWPLGRLPVDSWPAFRRAIVPRVLEKLPFFAIALAAALVTYLAQSAGGGASAMSPIPLGPRITNALVSYVDYLLKTLWPAGLASFYPHPGTVRADVPVAPAIGAALLLVVATVWVLRERVRRPYLAWGWLWYVGTLVPVIGLVQVGGQAMADRYTYVPLIGVFVAVVWGGADLVSRRAALRLPAAIAGAVAVGLLAIVAYRQAGFWRDSVTLHERSLAVTERNWKAWQGLCDARLELGQLEEAVPACRAAIDVLPTFPEAWQTLGVAYGRMGQPETAIPFFLRALELRPDYFNALRNLGSALANLGRLDEAAARLREALRIDPAQPDAWADLALALLLAGDRSGALDAYRQVERLDPARAEVLRRRMER